jgi:hypothetical protein
MNSEEHRLCPNCGASVAKTDVVCRNCGADLVGAFKFTPKESEVSVESSSENTDVRYYSLSQRFRKLVSSPSDAMEDVAHWPDYAGPVVIIFFLAVLASVDISLVYQKIQWTGDPAVISAAQNMVTGIIAIAIVIGVLIVVVFWLVKSLLVKAFCDGGSGWSFGTAASVTGYAYIADLIIGIIAAIVVIPLLPSVTFNVSDTSALSTTIANYQAQILWIRLGISLPLEFVGLIWKSYLGGLGTKYGTDERSSLGKGFAVFFVLALLGLLITFLLNPSSI